MIYLMRHGLDDESFVGGWSDVDLIPKGVKQVESTLKKMKEANIKIDKIITSDVKRALTTAELVKKEYPNATLDISDKFREQNKGILNGMNKELAKKKYPIYFDSVTVDTVYEGGESLRNLYFRVNEMLDDILSLEDNTLIITHRGVINMLYYILDDIELDMDKKKFKVSHASLHELDSKSKNIRKVF